MGMVKNCVATCHTALTALERTHLPTVNTYLDEKAVQELRVKEGLSFMDA
jgi:hypothetical protein